MTFASLDTTDSTTEGIEHISRGFDAPNSIILSDLKAQLNSIADSVYNDYPEVICGPKPFDSHRFCEEGIAEPNSSSTDNWLSLASWGDQKPADVVAVHSNPAVDIASQAIPDAATFASSSDWSDLTLCGMAKAGVISSVDGRTKVTETVELSDGTNISISDTAWWKASKYVKTFHHRSTGHRGYRDLVMGTWVV